MLVLLNFQNREKSFVSNILSINLPVIVAQLLTYPLLRCQTALLVNPPAVPSAIKYNLQHMILKEKYPKILQGIRYSIDHSITHSTLRYFTLNFIASSMQKYGMLGIPFLAPVLLSTALTTLISQPSLVQRTVASGLNAMDYESFTKKMKGLDLKKVSGSGLRYSMIINLLSTSLDLSYLNLFRKYISQSIGYELVGGVLITIAVSAIIHPLHYLRVLQINKLVLGYNQTPSPKEALSGVMTSILRRGVYNSLLFSMYLGYNFYSAKNDYYNSFQKRQMGSRVYALRDGAENNKVKSIFDFN